MKLAIKWRLGAAHNRARLGCELGMTSRGDRLVRSACAEKLIGVRTFTPRDATDRILLQFTGTSPCERRGPLEAQYWTRLACSILRRLAAPEEKSFETRIPFNSRPEAIGANLTEQVDRQ